MHPRIQKLLAASGGICVIVLSVAWAFYSSPHIASILGRREGLASQFPDGDALYKKYGDIYTSLSVLGLAVAAGLAFTLLCWERRPKRWRIEVTFWLLLALALPMSLINFWSGDVFVSRSQQIVLTLVQVFLTAVCLLQLSRRETSTDAEAVLKAMTMLFLLAFGLFVPLLFAAIWSVHSLHLISYEDSKTFSSGWVSVISGIAALVISVLQYRLAKVKHASEAQESASKIVLR